MSEPGSMPPGAPAPGSPVSEYAGFERDDLLRYARHFVLPQVGPSGQRKLSKARVLLVGAGGLGSPAALYLAAAGVGTLGVVDPDLVDLSNLQRQILHGISELGQLKVESARRSLWALNPGVEVVTYPTRLSSSNALEILEGYDLVVDGSDNFPARYLINDACVLKGIPYVYGAVDRWEGQISVFAAPGGPCYRCLFREPPPPGLVPSCAEAGVLGVLPGVMGSLQATEVLKMILEVGEPLIGRLVVFDALNLVFREVRLARNPDCVVCGDHPSQKGLLDYQRFCGVAELGEEAGEDDGNRQTPRISPADLKSLLGEDVPPFLLDVREPYEWEIGNLASQGAVLIPYGQVPRRLDEVPRDRTVVVYCHVGVRSALVVQELRRRGVEDVRNLVGGYLAWVDEVDPSLPRY